MKELTTKSKTVALALGYFDCVHYAHRKIISEVVSFARNNQIKSAVFTFSNELSSKGSEPVYSFSDRKKLINELEADYIIAYHFDGEFKNMSKTAFLEMLFDKYDIGFICCGSDYRFGAGGEGDVTFLKDFALKRGVVTQVFEPITMGGEVISTTLIKDALLSGNIKKANKLLCYPYFIEGKVTRGRGRGAALGFPTANLKPVDKFLPKFGVYKSRTFVDGKMFPSVTSIGNKPTFDDEVTTVETFIDGNVFNIYAKNIKVELLDYIRGLKKFASAAELKEQIKKDISKTL